MRTPRCAVLLLWLAGCAPPERPACNAHPEPGALGSICGFDHPEDLVLVEDAGVVVASGLEPGAGIWALALDELASRGRGVSGPRPPTGRRPRTPAILPARSRPLRLRSSRTGSTRGRIRRPAR